MKCECCGQEIKKSQAPKQRRLSDSQIQSAHPEKFKEGYHTGLNWDASWYPGGPHYTNMIGENKNRAWLVGFHKGLNQRLASNKRFAKWWNSERTRACNYSRYTENEDE